MLYSRVHYRYAFNRGMSVQCPLMCTRMNFELHSYQIEQHMKLIWPFWLTFTASIYIYLM